jgi:hypothetical protein
MFVLSPEIPEMIIVQAVIEMRGHENVSKPCFVSVATLSLLIINSALEFTSVGSPGFGKL